VRQPQRVISAAVGILIWTCSPTSSTPARSSAGEPATVATSATRPLAGEHVAKPLRIGGDVVAPVVVKRVDPDWSKVPKGFRYAGIVLLEAVIDEKGIPVNVRAIKGQPELTEPSIAALKQWRFKPGALHGKPVPVIFNLSVNPHYR
jgi:hypothetical protein